MDERSGSTTDPSSDTAREDRIDWRDLVEEGGADFVVEEAEAEVTEGLLLEIRTGEQVGDDTGSVSNKESVAD